MGIKSGVRRLLLVPGVTAPFHLLVRDRAVIFMLHRFRSEQTGCRTGLTAASLRTLLAYLRRHHYQILPLPELVSRLDAHETMRRTVAITIDDGYWEQGCVAGPVFAEFDCPATTFLCTGFLDQMLWFWWDRIEYIFEQTTRQALALQTEAVHLQIRWASPLERRAHQLAFTSLCKGMPEAKKHELITALAAEAEVDLPSRAPLRYAPMSWDDVRACERQGMTFGPHTVTHPILARTDDAQARRELGDSWDRLRSEVSKPVSVFCYPNGGTTDFGSREIDHLRKIGIRAAVVGAEGYAQASKFHADRHAPYKVERFGMSSELADLVQFVSGFERFKYLLRGRDC